MHTGPISNGLLLGMTPQRRSTTILELGTNARRKLAHIASLGAELEIQKASEHLDAGHRAWADAKLDHARSLSRLAAELTRDPEEG